MDERNDEEWMISVKMAEELDDYDNEDDEEDSMEENVDVKIVEEVKSNQAEDWVEGQKNFVGSTIDIQEDTDDIMEIEADAAAQQSNEDDIESM